MSRVKAIQPFDDYNNSRPRRDGIVGTITTTFGHNALRNGWKLLIEYD